MIPERLGRYEIQAEIGQGAMGRVYRAFDPIFHRLVAVKAIKGEILGQDDSGDYLRRFQREAQAVGALSHPAIVTIYDVGEAYFVMEYLEGTTLSSLLQRRARFPLGEVLPIISPVADALDFAHKKGIIHRDIKPANIMVLPDGSPKIMDFGLAHLDSTVLTTAGQFLGSPSYMSPEQVLGGKLTPAADVYALAVVTYEMLTGKKPFAGSHVTTIVYKVVHELPEPPRKWNQDLPEYYDDVFAQALAKDPKERHASASELIAALNLKEIGDNTLGLDFLELISETAPNEVRAGDETTELRSTPLPAVTRPEPVLSITERNRRTVAPTGRRYQFLGAALVALVVAGFFGSWLATRGPSTPLATIQVETDPEGASVTLDGIALGTAPVVFPSVAPGAHTLRVHKEGYSSAERAFDVRGGEALPLLRFALTKGDALLSLRSDPEGASVKVDGKLAGTAPLTRYPLTPGTHQIVAQLENHRPWSIEVESAAGETLNLMARLIRDERLSGARRDPESRERDASRAPEAPGKTPREVELVELGPGDTPPRKISGEAASYPPAARRMRQEGSVTLEMTVTEDGVPADFKVVQSAGAILDHAVIKAVGTWRYEPALRKGVKVRVRTLVRQSFRLGS